jgi:Cof subfamily protein (haloacid dehalogenase superfamily)
MRYRLLALDVDGTLLDSDHHLRPRVVAAVRAARAAGLAIALATGKQFRSIRALLGPLELTGPQICLNGAAVTAGERADPLAFTPLADAARRAVIAAVRAAAPDFLISQFALDAIYVDRAHPGLGVFAEYGEQEPTLVPDLLIAPLPPAAKLLIAGPPEGIPRLRAAISPELAERVYITTTMPEFLEFFTFGADKGAALATLRAHLGIPREATVAIGDGENDLPLFREAGLAIAMSNAGPAVRAAAQLVAPSNDADGVAVALDELLSRNTNALDP